MKKTISAIITLMFLGAAIYFVVLPSGGVLARNVFSSQDAPLKKELPTTKVILAKDSRNKKYLDSPFDHVTHSTKNYSPDGKALITCVECHHTDQPASALKPPLKKSERAVALTLEALKAPDAVGVKLCRACHLQVTDKSKEIPEATLDGEDEPTLLTNEISYHRNCEICHDKAITARPELKGKIGGTSDKDCYTTCHKPL